MSDTLVLTTHTLSVLVVDDSAVVRQFMTRILTRDPTVRVRVAADPVFARAKIAAERPDVILLDLETPRVHGLQFLREIMANEAIPVVICSSFVGPGSDAAMQALQDGALDLVSKPEFGVREFLEDNATMLLDKLRAAAAARLTLRPRAQAAASTPSVAAVHPPRTNAPGTPKSDVIVAIGASTGGTEAIQTVLEAMPVDAPPIVVVQHMPAGFTQSFARRLDTLCRIDVKEAEDGDRVRPGRALIAPGNQHMVVVRDGAYAAVQLRGGPMVSRHRPSVDVLFDAMASAVGARGVGMILTGMGDDGAQGMLHMRNAGAHTLAQDEASCVVFGMPKEAIALGGVQRVLPIEEMAGAVLHYAATRALR